MRGSDKPLDKRALLEGDLKIHVELERAQLAEEQRTHRLVSVTKAPTEITYAWDNIDVYTKPDTQNLSRCCKKTKDNGAKHILKNVSGLVRPGELLAIMGASGAGKTTLLNVLTFRNLKKLEVSGNVFVNGHPVKAEHLAAISAYVQQDDLFIGTLTVKEVLRFQALLKMDRHFSRKERMDRVQEVILELGLSKCANTLVGIPGRVRGISGGEMKRLAFACEVLTDPPLLLCDEPTSGLDSFMAQNVVGVMKALAEKGKTIVATIHQPSSEVYAMFDRLLLMAEGRVAYLGDVDGAFEFFKNNGYQCPSNFNPADYFIHVLAVIPGREEESRGNVAAICDAFEASPEGSSIKTQAAQGGVDPATKGNALAFSDDAIEKRGVYKAGWWAQLRTLVWRSTLSVSREPLILKVRLFQTVMVSILLGIIYLQQELSQEGVQNINGALFLFLTNMTFQNAFAVINVFCQEQLIFLREHYNGMYRTDTYFLSKMIAEFPMFILYPTIFTVVTYFIIGLNPGVDRFFTCLFIVILVSNTACSFGYMISCLSSSVTMALSLAPPIIVPFMLFGGFFLNSASVPVYFEWIKWLSWFLYGYESLAVNQWEGIESISCSAFNNATGTCLFKDGASVLNYYNFRPANLWRDIICLGVLVLGYRLLAYIFLLIKTFRQR